MKKCDSGATLGGLGSDVVSGSLGAGYRYGSAMAGLWQRCWRSCSATMPPCEAGMVAGLSASRTGVKEKR